MAELRQLKQLQARIFEQLRIDRPERESRETIERRDEMETLTRLTRMLLEVAQTLRAERDALATELKDQNRIAELRKAADEIMAFAAARQPRAEPIETEDEHEPAAVPHAFAQAPRRALNAERRATQRPLVASQGRGERMARALRS